MIFSTLVFIFKGTIDIDVIGALFEVEGTYLISREHIMDTHVFFIGQNFLARHSLLLFSVKIASKIYPFLPQPQAPGVPLWGTAAAVPCAPGLGECTIFTSAPGPQCVPLRGIAMPVPQGQGHCTAPTSAPPATPRTHLS